MRLGMILCLFITTISCSKDSFISHSSETSTVYICKGSHSKSYHFDKECEGLRSCTTEIFETELESTEKKGRTLCGYEQ